VRMTQAEEPSGKRGAQRRRDRTSPVNARVTREWGAAQAGSKELEDFFVTAASIASWTVEAGRAEVRPCGDSSKAALRLITAWEKRLE